MAIVSHPVVYVLDAAEQIGAAIERMMGGSQALTYHALYDASASGNE